MSTSTSHPQFQAVFSLLKQQLSKINDFQNHLKEIKVAITENKIEQLENLIGNTTGFYAALESIQNQLHILLNKEGFSASHLEQFIQQHDDANQQLEQIKSDINKQLTILEKLLVVNDLLVRKNQHRIKQSIRILSGHGLSEGPATYSREGNSEIENVSKKTLARA